MSTASRRRLSPDESRLAALEAARALLLEAGPQAVTLKAVSSRIDRTHANLLHHFGSAAGLQRALAHYLAQQFSAAVAAAYFRAREEGADPGEVVDLTFDAWDQQGGGALVAWMLASGNEDALEPVITAIRAGVEQISAGDPHARVIAECALMLVLMALGDSLIGAPMTQALGLPRTSPRNIVRHSLLCAMAEALAQSDGYA